MCYIKLWKATATALERRSANLTDWWQLCAALPCVALQHPVCPDLASKDVIDPEYKPSLQHEGPTRAEKMQDWEAWVRGQRIAMTIWYYPERSIRIWCLHEDNGLSFPYRLQKFPLFLSSSYRLQKFADTDRLRVNRRPTRKDFFPDRYDFVPIVFTSSSCKRGLRSTKSSMQSQCGSKQLACPKQSTFLIQLLTLTVQKSHSYCRNLPQIAPSWESKFLVVSAKVQDGVASISFSACTCLF